MRVAAVIAEQDAVLLVRHECGDRSYFLLPGGGVEFGETIADALVREVREETGVECEVVSPLFINDSIDPSGGRHMIQITLLARAVSRPEHLASTDPRVAAAEFVPAADLAKLDLRPPMADELCAAVSLGFQAPARYLGALWVDENGVTGTGSATATDG